MLTRLIRPDSAPVAISHNIMIMGISQLFFWRYDMTETYTLCDLHSGECAAVIEILPTCPIKRRLYDVGLIGGTPVKCLYQSAGKDMKAYLIRGAVIAIRNRDCAQVLISKEAHSDEET